MIAVEADAGEDWPETVDWAGLADRAVRAAIAHGVHAGLIDSGITIEVSVKFASDGEVKALNATYRNKDEPTNVLSFPMFDAALIDSIGRAAGGEVLLGDIVLAYAVCADQARDKRIDIVDHVAHLIVHGTLHLLGYDHETGEADAEAMERTEQRALAAIGVADPYVTEVQS